MATRTSFTAVLHVVLLFIYLLHVCHKPLGQGCLPSCTVKVFLLWKYILESSQAELYLGSEPHAVFPWERQIFIFWLGFPLHGALAHGKSGILGTQSFPEMRLFPRSVSWSQQNDLISISFLLPSPFLLCLGGLKLAWARRKFWGVLVNRLIG